MDFLKAITIRNFRCFRAPVTVDLGNSTYLTGINNSGKTAILTAIRCFFDTTAFNSEFINKTEFAGKKGDYNRSDISISFDLSLITGAARKARMIQVSGPIVAIKKSFTYRAISGIVVVQYSIGESALSDFEDLDQDIQDMLNGVTISYIHPQEGAALLEKAQSKFKQRLFNNWGRHASVAEKLKTLQTQWSDLRKTANSYLSAALTENLRKIWPNSATTVDLPEKIEDIVAVSDITFRSSTTLPEISLTGQGTGAQSAILYQTHYILDSDRSLHRGLYFPIWLLEEPESFLHADIAAKLGELLNSDEWLKSIQMIISTHSPIILAASRKNATKTRWAIVSNHTIEYQKPTSEVDEADIKKISSLMGDSNFDAYFTAAVNHDLVFVEDERQLTREKFKEASIPIVDSPAGTSELKKFILVYSTVPNVIKKRAFFIIDSDKGVKEFSQYCTAESLVKEKDGFSLHKCADRVFIILLPKNTAAEDLFDEYAEVIDDCIKKLFKTDWTLADSVPTELTRAMGILRRKQPPRTKEEARELIQNEQDVKDLFWARVKSSGYVMSSLAKAAFQELLQ
jgi:hypothetical protein